MILALAAAGPLSAQMPAPGTLVIGMHMKLPDSVKMPVPVGTGVDLQISVMSDGHRIAADIAPGPEMTSPMVQGMHLRTLYTLGTDTVHIGILLSPQMVPAAGGVPGFRLDLPVKTLDSLRRGATAKFDSISAKLIDSLRVVASHVTYRSLGSTATVAGIRCEEWETVAAMDTTRICLIPTPAAMLALQNYVKRISGMGPVMDQLPAIGDAARQAFGGRDMTSIRTMNQKTGLVIELRSYTPGAPDAALLDLPANLQPLPGMPGSKPPGGGTDLERQ